MGRQITLRQSGMSLHRAQNAVVNVIDEINHLSIKISIVLPNSAKKRDETPLKVKQSMPLRGLVGSGPHKQG